MNPTEKQDTPRQVDGATIHWCDRAQIQTLHIACSDTWTTPRRGSAADKATGIENVYRADTGDLYTSDRQLVTCSRCQVGSATEQCSNCQHVQSSAGTTFVLGCGKEGRLLRGGLEGKPGWCPGWAPAPPYTPKPWAQ